MALGAEHSDDLQLDQLLQAVAHELGNQFTGSAAIQSRRQGRGTRIRLGQGSSG